MKDIFFITGMPRSGTTLLRSILASHPLVYVPREIGADHHFALYSASQKLQSKGSFFKYYTTTKRFKDLGFESTEYLVDGKEPQSAKELYLRLQEIHNKRGLGKIIGFKTPSSELHLDTILKDFRGVKVIHLLRDPRAVFRSLRDVPWNKDQHVSVVIKRLNKSINSILRFEQEPNVMIVKYEDLVADPESITKEICSFLEIEFSPGMIQDRKMEPVVKSEGEWTNKYESEVERAIDSKSINKWETELSKQDIAYINFFCKPYHRFYDLSGTGSLNSLEIIKFNILKNLSKIKIALS